MKRNRRSFLKAALGCATALVVPGALPSVTPKDSFEGVYKRPKPHITTWYKPGIWAGTGGTFVMYTNPSRLKHVHWDEEAQGWKEGPSSKRS